MRPVELLEQNHPRELMGQRHRAQRQTVVHPLQGRRAEGAADHERHVRPHPAALLQERAEGEAVVGPPLRRQQRDERPPRDPPRDRLRGANLHQLQLHITGEQPAVVGHVILERRAHPRLADYGQGHGLRY